MIMFYGTALLRMPSESLSYDILQNSRNLIIPHRILEASTQSWSLLKIFPDCTFHFFFFLKCLNDPPLLRKKHLIPLIT